MQTTNTTKSTNNLSALMHIPGVDKVEVYWLGRTIGTHHINHPVAQRRARRILHEMKQQLNMSNVLKDMQNILNNETTDLVFFKKQAG